MHLINIGNEFLNLCKKMTTINFDTWENIKDKKVPQTIMEDFMKEDKEVRLLAYKILVNKFNEKYETLSEVQKNILTKYVNSISDTKSLTVFLNEKISDITNKLSSIKKSTNDKVLKIKLDEVIKLIKPIEEGKSIKDEAVIGILQCYDLIEEIKTKNG